VEIAQGLKGIWVFAEVFLFTLTGTSLSFDATNGPLYGQRGPSAEMISKVISVMFIGTAARIVSVAISVAAMYWKLPEHRRELKWIIPFGVNCYIYQMPKATVQATLGGVAYTQHIIPGAVGLNKGLIIAQCTAFTVLIFAPLGSVLTKFVGAPISLYLTKLDKEARWKDDEQCYSQSSKYVHKGSELELVPSADNLAAMVEGDYENEVQEKLAEPNTIVDDITYLYRNRSNTVEALTNIVTGRARKKSQDEADDAEETLTPSFKDRGCVSALEIIPEEGYAETHGSVKV
jgi:hypothetical protein